MKGLANLEFRVHTQSCRSDRWPLFFGLESVVRMADQLFGPAVITCDDIHLGWPF